MYLLKYFLKSPLIFTFNYLFKYLLDYTSSKPRCAYLYNDTLLQEELMKLDTELWYS